MTQPALIVVLLLWALLMTGVLRTLRMARRLDELTARQWERLAKLHSASGVAFFPTRDARLELEVAIVEALRGRGRAVRRRRRAGAAPTGLPSSRLAL
jgi:hypothetical protein